MKVPTIFTAVDRFSSVVNKMTRSTTAFGESASAAAMRTSRKFSDAGTTLLASGAGMAAGIGLAVNEAVKFEKAMANVSTTIDSTPELMKEMSNSVLEMATRIPVPISQLTDALYDVVSAGIDAKDSMFVLEQSSKLGIAGLGTAKEGVDIITSSLNSFNLKASESANVANMVFKAVKYGKTTVSQLAESFGSSSALVKNANVSLEEYLATTAVLTTTGMTASRAQTQISSAVSALIKPSGTMSKVFKKLGVKDVPAWIKSNGSLVKSLQIVRDEGEKMGLLTSKSFGRKEGFSAMLSLLGPLAEKYKLVMGDIVSGTDSMTEAVAKQQKTFSAQFQIMKNKVTKLAITIGNELMPRISGFIDTISPIVEGVTGWADRNSWLASTILTITAGLLALGALAKIGAALFFGYAKALKVVTFFTDIFAEATLIATTYGVGLSTAFGVLAGEMLVTIGTFLSAIATFVAVIAALYALYKMMHMNDDVVRNFSQNNKTHLGKVSGDYETMEQRIAKSNDRIVSNMKKLKMDLESVEKTGKTSAEIAQEKIANLAKEASRKRFKHIPSAVSSTSTNVVIPRVLGLREVSKEELSAYSGAGDAKHKNLAGTVNPYAQDLINKIEVVIKDPGNNAESVKVNGKNYAGGLPAKTDSTTGVKN